MRGPLGSIHDRRDPIYRHFEEFNRYSSSVTTGHTYEERIGSPDVVSSGIGHVALGFAGLEDSLNAALAALLNTDPRAASTIAAEISFKAKVHILSSLVRERTSSREFNCGTDDPTEVFQELVSLLFRAEELRNQVMHSAWVDLPGTKSILSEGRRTMRRRKITAKANRGLNVHEETLSGDDLLDIYDFILNVEYVFEEFFMDGG